MTPTLHDLLAAAYAARDAYERPNLVSQNVQARLVYHPEHKLVDLAIAGTNDRRDMRENFNLLKRRHFMANSSQRVSAPFYAHAHRLMALCEDAVTKHGADPEELTYEVRGHSLGGIAGCLLAALWPALRKSKESRVITFGAPPGGNQAFANWFTANVRPTVIRVEADGDEIVTLPDRFWTPVGFAYRIPGRPGLDHPISSYIRTLENMIASTC